MDFLSLLDAGTTGGVLGLLGSGLSHVMTLMRRRQDLKHELSLRETELNMMREEAVLAERRAKIEADSSAFQQNTVAYVESLRHDESSLNIQGSSLLAFAEFIRKIFRPLATGVLIWLTAEVYFSAMATPEMRMNICQAVIAFAGMALSWWFVDRTVTGGSRGR